MEISAILSQFSAIIIVIYPLFKYNPMENAFAVTLVRSIRQMHAHVIVAADGQRYFVKCHLPGYCEGRPVMGIKIAAVCGVTVVEPVKVVFDEEFVARFARNNAPQFEGYAPSIHTGTFFGTRYPADPDRTAIFDLLPCHLASQVRNIPHFSIMRTVDCWIANASSGRAIFVRQPEKDFIAYMLGFGRCLSFDETDIRANFNRPLAPLITSESWQVAEQTIDVIRKITRKDLKTIAHEIPTAWWRRDGESAHDIIETLLRRQSDVGRLLTALRCAECELPIRKLVHSEAAPATTLKQWA